MSNNTNTRVEENAYNRIPLGCHVESAAYTFDTTEFIETEYDISKLFLIITGLGLNVSKPYTVSTSFDYILNRIRSRLSAGSSLPPSDCLPCHPSSASGTDSGFQQGFQAYKL